MTVEEVIKLPNNTLIGGVAHLHRRQVDVFGLLIKKNIERKNSRAFLLYDGIVYKKEERIEPTLYQVKWDKLELTEEVVKTFDISRKRIDFVKKKILILCFLENPRWKELDWFSVLKS